MVHDVDQPRPDARHLLCVPPDLSTSSRHVRLPGEPFAVAVVVTVVLVALFAWAWPARRTASEVGTTPAVITVDNVVEPEYAPDGHGAVGQMVVRVASGPDQ